jgi:hypothetical protein
MNINTILDILLNQRLGLVEYKLNYLYPEIHKNLMTNTLPIFSQYFPCYRRYDFTPADHKTDVDDEYYLDIPEITANKLHIISIADVKAKSGIEGNAFMDAYRPFAMTIEDVLINSAATNIASLSSFSYRKFKFIAPNRLRLKGYSESELYITFKMTYPSFSAIADSVIEQFLDLAEADIKIFIFNKLKHYDQLSMPIGNVDLKLSLFESGESDRKEVIDRFNSKGYPNKAGTGYYRYE